MKRRVITLIIVVIFLLSVGGFAYNRYRNSYGNEEYREEPPVRVSYVQGDVMVQRGFDLGFEDVTINLPLVDGDRLVTEQGRVELDLGDGNFLRLDNNTRIEIGQRGESLRVKIWEGSLYLSLNRFTREGDIILDFREGEVVPLDRGEIRVNMYSRTTEVIVREGLAEVITDEGSRYVRRSQKIRVDNGRFISRPVYLYSSTEDDFDQWNDFRDNTFRERLNNRRRNRYEDSYLPEVLSSYEDEFYDNGRWVYTSDYGYCWRPMRVISTWRPYYNGRWTWVYPYGWTWVSYDPWWYTYHYGRWMWDPMYGWIWAPGYRWGPAWVDWFYYDDYIGWAPIDWYGRPVIVINNVWVRHYSRIPLSARSVVVLKKSSLMARNISRVAINTGSLRKVSLKKISLRPLGAQPFAAQTLKKVRVGNKVILKRNYTPVIKTTTIKYSSRAVKIVKPAPTFRKITSVKRESFTVTGKKGSSVKVIRKSSGSSSYSRPASSSGSSKVIRRKSSYSKTGSGSSVSGSGTKKVIKKKSHSGSSTVSSSGGSSSSSSTKKKIKKKKEDYYSYYYGNSGNSNSDYSSSNYGYGRYTSRYYRKNPYYGGRYKRRKSYAGYSNSGTSSYSNYSSKRNPYNKYYSRYGSRYNGNRSYYGRRYSYSGNYSSNYNKRSSGSFWSRFKNKAFSSSNKSNSYFKRRAYKSYSSYKRQSYSSPRSYRSYKSYSSSGYHSWARTKAFSNSSSYSGSSAFSHSSSSSSSSSSHSTFKKRD